MSKVKRKNLAAGFATVVCVTLAGCSSKPFVVGKTGDALPAEDVIVYYAKRPVCEFETIAHLKMENPYFSLQTLVNEMRLQAAELGAEAVYVEETRRLPGREYVGTGRAIRCTDPV